VDEDAEPTCGSPVRVEGGFVRGDTDQTPSQRNARGSDSRHEHTPTSSVVSVLKSEAVAQDLLSVFGASHGVQASPAPSSASDAARWRSAVPAAAAAEAQSIQIPALGGTIDMEPMGVREALSRRSPCVRRQNAAPHSPLLPSVPETGASSTPPQPQTPPTSLPPPQLPSSTLQSTAADISHGASPVVRAVVGMAPSLSKHAPVSRLLGRSSESATSTG
jgi:hypothetical protein